MKARIHPFTVASLFLFQATATHAQDRSEIRNIIGEKTLTVQGMPCTYHWEKDGSAWSAKLDCVVGQNVWPNSQLTVDQRCVALAAADQTEVGYFSQFERNDFEDGTYRHADYTASMFQMTEEQYTTKAFLIKAKEIIEKRCLGLQPPKTAMHVYDDNIL